MWGAAPDADQQQQPGVGQPSVMDVIMRMMANMEQMMATMQMQAQSTRQSGSDRSHSGARMDPKAFSELETFSGTGWKDWAFRFETATASTSTIAKRMLEWAAREDRPIVNFDTYPPLE